MSDLSALDLNLIDQRIQNLGLPICSHLESIRSELVKQSQLILVAEPGAGKTTTVPLNLLPIVDFPKKILLLEPRRLAARNAAERMAEIIGQPVGKTIGYRIRNEHKVSKDTRIEVITEGILTRMIQSDPELQDVAAIIFDEFHERSLDADLGLAFSLEVQQSLREDLLLIVMSATLQIDAVSRVFDKANVINCEGRCFPVEIEYIAPKNHLGWDSVLTSALFKAKQVSKQDILVFLPGASEIFRAESIINESRDFTDFEIHKLYGALPFGQQRSALTPSSDKRKIILSTNIAETSVTIEGVDCVIDSGLARVSLFNPNVGFNRLQTQSISSASAEQRTGRAGRLSSGFCFRLWSEQQALRQQTPAEIIRSDLAPFALELAMWGSNSPQDLNLIDQPTSAAYQQATDLLISLEALNEGRRITPHGKNILALGIHPRLGHMLIRSKELGQVELACRLAALLEEKDLLHGKNNVNEDIAYRVHLLSESAFKSKIKSNVLRQAARLKQRLSTVQLDIEETKSNLDQSFCGVLLGFAFPDRIAKKRGQGYLLANGSGVNLDRDSTLSSEYLSVGQLGGSGSTAKVFVAAEINIGQIESYFSNLLLEREEVFWEEKSQSVIARKILCLGKIEISKKPFKQVPQELLISSLVQGIRSNGIEKLDWDNTLLQWRAKVSLLNQIEEFKNDFPNLSDQSLTASLENWLAPYLIGKSKLSQVDKELLSNALNNLVGWDKQQRIEMLMPERIKVASGSKVKVDYLSGEKPILAVKLQEMFGEKTTPQLAQGKIPLVVHLLSPARRPLQVTEDLASFWQNGYSEVKKEMKGRYPKHPWPDDPLNAVATAKTKKFI